MQDVTTLTVPRRAHPMRARLAFTLLGAVQATLVFTITLLVVPLPVIGRAFGLDASGLIVLSTAYGLPFSGLLLLGGRLSDRFGARRLFKAGMTTFVGGSLAAVMAPGFVALTAARAVQGTGAALVAPAALSLLRALITDPERYRRATATWGGLSVLGATSGTVLSGLVTTWLSWRWMFAVPLTVTGAALVLTRRLLPDPPAPANGTLDVPGAVLATGGICVGSYGFAMTGADRWTSATVLAPLSAGAASLVGFVVRGAREREPLLPLSFLADRHRIIALVAIAVAAAGTAVVFLYLTLYLQQVRGWSPLRTSAGLVPYALSLIVSGRVAARLLGRFRTRAVLAAGLVVAASGLAVLATLDPATSYSAGLLPGTILLPAGVALCFAAAGLLAVGGVPPERTGLASGVMNTAMEIGPTVGLALLSTVAAARAHARLAAGADRAAAATSGYGWAIGTTATCFAAVAAAALLVSTRTSLH